MSDIFVLDSCALVALLKQDKGAEVVADIYKLARRGHSEVFLNRINLLEVYYGFYRDEGFDYAWNILKNIEQSIITIAEFDKAVFLEAGRLKSIYKISLADAVVLAQAIILKGKLVTADHYEFDAIEGREALSFCWIK